MSVIPDVDHRKLPLVAVRREGGVRNVNLPDKYSRPVVRMTAVSGCGLIRAEELYEASLEVLFAAVRAQQIVPGVGYLQSLRESQGPSVSVSDDLWAVEGSLEVGLREQPSELAEPVAE